jgi:uncharacterized protein YuzE
MRLHVDHKADALYLRLDDAKIVESEEIAPGVVVDFDDKNRVVGVEVFAIPKRVPKSKPLKYPTSDILWGGVHEASTKRISSSVKP